MRNDNESQRLFVLWVFFNFECNFCYVFIGWMLILNLICSLKIIKIQYQYHCEFIQLISFQELSISCKFSSSINCLPFTSSPPPDSSITHISRTDYWPISPLQCQIHPFMPTSPFNSTQMANPKHPWYSILYTMDSVVSHRTNRSGPCST